MPELPEVETVRRLLLPDVLGSTVRRVEVRSAHAVAGTSPARFAELVCQREIAALSRRGKYLVFHLRGSRPPELTMLAHLRMTGRLLWLPAGEAVPLPPHHIHAVLHLQGPAGAQGAPASPRRDGAVYFYDVRKFGRLLLCPPQDLDRHLPSGRDPLLEGVSAADLRRLLGQRRSHLKALLLRQDLLCGLGNIYADEALHRAGLHPATRPEQLPPDAWRRLARAIREVLAEALAMEGTTLQDYRRPDGQPGRFAAMLRVYGRGGRPCRACGTPVATLRLAGRTTAYCPRCQPPP